jgi:SAM-dependent methyltransferase
VRAEPSTVGPVSVPPVTVESQRELYEQVYSSHDERNQRWKQLCATENIGPLQQLLSGTAIAPASVIDVGCGDGSVMAEMSRHGLGSRFVGYEIAPSAVAYTASREIPGLERVELFDGVAIAEDDDAFDLGLLHFVIDQAMSPDELLAEVRRVSRHVLVAVVLDDTRRMRAKLRNGGPDRFGRLQLYDQASIRRQLAAAGLTVLADSIQPPGLREGTFWADSLPEKARAYALAAARSGIHTLAPRYAETLFGHSYRAICARG